ncbi:MAG: 4-hydroxy-3-methylbut-2-enyl diphosphate reductase [Synergistaceae bacterium]|nr:4-hydroxy-3-methylbut-2-enyl diphosphate reductase [Synergistaceae bacterium]
MNFVIANPTGLCFGVRRAIEYLEIALHENKSVYAMGNPIHNPQEVERLSRLGLKVASSVAEIPGGAAAFIRAHGLSRGKHAELREKCRMVIDGTCPFVRNVQKKAAELGREGYEVVVLGDSGHPEVKGILGHIDGEALVVKSEKYINLRGRRAKIGILSQTTQREADLAALASKLVFLTEELRVYNTICRATVKRQEAIKKLAESVDAVVVIGGRNSANTGALVEISRSSGLDAKWIEHAGELDEGWLRDKVKIGVAAGGSTPDWLVNDLTAKLLKL